MLHDTKPLRFALAIQGITSYWLRMMPDKKIENIFNIRHSKLQEKESNWQLILDCYRGGTDFKNGGYLIKYPKESQNSFEKRKDRAVYFNQLSPIVDMLSGMLFVSTPSRTIPKDMNFLLESVSGEKKLDEFMRLVAAYSFMFTIGVLVDSPDFDPEIIKTKKDRKVNKINPYTVMYLPQKIRDFYASPADGKLEWVLLDDSYTEHLDPFVEAEEVIKYTLWTRKFRQTFEKRENEKEVLVSDEMEHPIGEVPFRFVAWRDDNNDFIAETVCEDIAMVSKLIYNNMSYMDEMLAGGTFKMLTYPSKDGGIPKNMSSGGVGALSVIPYDIESSNVPSFIGAELREIDPFIKALEFYMSEILKKVGLSTDETKKFVKSGMAKKIDLQKMKALLISGALMMGKTETWIFETAGKWENKKQAEDVKSEYAASFSDEDLETEVTMLMELLVHPIEKLQTEVLNLITKKLLADDLKPEVMAEIYADIEKNASKIGGGGGGNFSPAQAAQQIKNEGASNKDE